MPERKVESHYRFRIEPLMIDRFPTDLMFQLDAQEFDSLRSQLATLNAGRSYRPFVFTGHEAAR